MKRTNRNILIILSVVLLCVLTNCSKSHGGGSDTIPAGVEDSSVAQIDSVPNDSTLKADSIMGNLKILRALVDSCDKVRNASIKELSSNNNKPDSTKVDSINNIYNDKTRALADFLIIQRFMPCQKDDDMAETPNSWLDFWKEISIWNILLIALICLVAILFGFVLGLLLKKDKGENNKKTKMPKIKKIKREELGFNDNEYPFFEHMTNHKD